MTIIEFLTARWDEVEAIASQPGFPDFEADDYFEQLARYESQLHTHLCGYRTGNGLDKECGCLGPADTLVDLALKRAIAEQHDLLHMCPMDDKAWTADPSMVEADGGYGGPCLTLRLLAAMYANHEDYNPAWSLPVPEPAVG